MFLERWKDLFDCEYILWKNTEVEGIVLIALPAYISFRSFFGYKSSICEHMGKFTSRNRNKVQCNRLGMDLL